MTMFEIGTLLGFAAGFLLLTSGFPMVREQIQRPSYGSKGERNSRLLMAFGNGLWVVAGLMIQAWPVAIMCGINALIQILIWVRMTWRGK